MVPPIQAMYLEPSDGHFQRSKRSSDKSLTALSLAVLALARVSRVTPQRNTYTVHSCVTAAALSLSEQTLCYQLHDR
jgi:hypothetical protein